MSPTLHGVVAVWQRQGYDCVEGRDDTHDNLPHFAFVPKVLVAYVLTLVRRVHLNPTGFAWSVEVNK